MANEGLIKFDWPDTGILTFTADILKADSSTRQAAIAFSDAGHLGRYKNTTSIPTIVAGDSIKLYKAGDWVSTEPYQPEVDVVTINKAIQTATLDTIKSETNTIAGDVENIDGDPMRGTDGANQVVPMSDGDSKLEHSATRTSISNLNNLSQADITNAMKAMMGITEGGTWSWEKVLKITTAFAAGNWRKKSDTTDELLDAEDGTTVILEQTITRSPASGSNFRTITVKI